MLLGGGASEAGFTEVGLSSHDLTIERSTIAGNSGEVGILGAGTATISDSTISGNTTAGEVVGMTAGSITNSTISGNAANFAFATGLGSTTMRSVTIAGNDVAAGAPVLAGNGATLTVQNTLAADNSGTARNFVAFPAFPPFIPAGTIVSGGHNLSDRPEPELDQASDIDGADPQLRVLDDNGGPTRTHALRPTSPAIDAGSSAGLTTDQRAQPRPVDQTSVPNAVGGDGADIGAFERAPISRLSVIRDGSGSGVVTSSPAGVACGQDCEEFYDSGTPVTLTATPGANSEPAQWSGCDSVNGSNQCLVQMTADKEVTASFALVKRNLTVAKGGSGAGTVTSQPTGVNCGSDCAEQFDHGTQVTLSASPVTGSGPAQWSGCDSVNGSNQCLVEMSADKAVTASFTLITRNLTLAKGGGGAGTVASQPTGIDCGSDCTEQFDHGTPVTLSATPAAGSEPAKWSGCDSVDASNQCVVQMSADKAVTASFALTPPPADTTAPETVITKSKVNSKKSKAKFTFSASEESSSFICKIDGEEAASCESPKTYKRLRPGRHSFEVFATDVAGNADATSAVKRFRIRRAT